MMWKIPLSETTVRSRRDAYRHAVSKRVKLGESTVINKLPEIGRGISNLIGDDMDQKVQAYIKNVRAGGGNISAAGIMGAAEGISLYYGKKKHVKLISRHWAYSLLKEWTLSDEKPLLQ